MHAIGEAHHPSVLPQRVVGSYWAEVTVYHREDQSLRGWHLGGYAARTPARALARLRLRVRQVACCLVEPEATRSCLAWLHDGLAMCQALESLARGEMYLHLVDEDGHTAYEFALRPIYFSATAEVPEGRASYDVIALHERRSA